MVSLCGPEFDSPQVHQMRGLQVVNSDLQPSLICVVDLCDYVTKEVSQCPRLVSMTVCGDSQGAIPCKST